MQITVDLLIFIGLLQSVWVLIVRFAVDLLIFEMAENWKVLVTGCKTLLIRWFDELLSCWAVELLNCWAVDLLSGPSIVIYLMVVLYPKIQSYWLQITVDLLILYWASSKCLSIDSAFCCWFVDFWNGRELKSLSYWLQNTVDLLICWTVELLSCWAVELLSSWSIEPFTCYFSNGCVRPKNSELPVAKHCWFVDLIFYSLSGSIDSAFCCWFVDFWKGSFIMTKRMGLLVANPCWFVDFNSSVF